MISKLNSGCSYFSILVYMRTNDIGRIDSFPGVLWMMTKTTLFLWSSATNHALLGLLLIAFKGSEKTLRVIILVCLYGITSVASWGALCPLGRRRSRTTCAATAAISVMTRLIVGMTVCTGIWTKALTVFKHGWWTAYVAAAAGAGTLHDCRRHQFFETQLLIAVNRYLVPEKRLRVAQFSQIMKMIITSILLLNWSVRSGYSLLGWVRRRYVLRCLVIVFNLVSFLVYFKESSLLACFYRVNCFGLFSLNRVAVWCCPCSLTVAEDVGIDAGEDWIGVECDTRADSAGH